MFEASIASLFTSNAEGIWRIKNQDMEKELTEFLNQPQHGGGCR